MNPSTSLLPNNCIVDNLRLILHFVCTSLPQPPFPLPCINAPFTDSFARTKETENMRQLEPDQREVLIMTWCEFDDNVDGNIGQEELIDFFMLVRERRAIYHPGLGSVSSLSPYHLSPLLFVPPPPLPALSLSLISRSPSPLDAFADGLWTNAQANTGSKTSHRSGTN